MTAALYVGRKEVLRCLIITIQGFYIFSDRRLLENLNLGGKLSQSTARVNNSVNEEH